jgi:hypothetical protein
MRKALLIVLTLLVPSTNIAYSQTTNTATGTGQSFAGASAGAGSSVQYNPTTIAPASRIPNQAPAVFAPGLAAAAVETCLGSVSAGGSGPFGGLSFGTTVTDEGCQARLNARTLVSLGQPNAALVLMCRSDARIAESLYASGWVCPSVGDTLRAVSQVKGKRGKFLRQARATMHLEEPPAGTGFEALVGSVFSVGSQQIR